MPNRFPLIINSSTSQIQELPNADALELTGCTIVNSAATLTLPTSTGTLALTSQLPTLGTGVASFLATPSSANLASAVTDETGSGALVFGTAPSLTNATETNVFLVGAREKVTVSTAAATGTIAFDYTTQAVLYYTSNATANWTLNIRGNSGTTLNSIMTTGDALTIAFIVPQGGTAYYNTSVQVDGTTSGVTTTWSGGAPTKGNASGQDHYTYTIIKTANAAFTIFAAQTQFKA
jgi:hypothetical protein